MEQLPRILLAEDDADDQKLAIVAMRSTGLSLAVHVVRDGQEAADALGLTGMTRRTEPQLIISDLKMPRLDGKGLLGLARNDERYKTTPFVMFTSSDFEWERSLCESLGVSEFVTKPNDFEEFRHRLSMIVRQWVGHALVDHHVPRFVVL